jgi:hypothetical protein
MMIGSAIAEAGGKEKKICYIENVFTKAGKRYAKINIVKWFQGEEAIRMAKKEHPEAKEPSPNGYYISHRNAKKRTLMIADSAQFIMQTYSHKSDGDFRFNEKILFHDFARLFTKKDTERFRRIPFWIVVLKGTIVTISEQYIP